MGGSQGPAGRAVSACGHLGCIIESIIIMSFHSILSSVRLFSSVIRTLLLSQAVKCCEKVAEHQCTHDTGFHFNLISLMCCVGCCRAVFCRDNLVHQVSWVPWEMWALL